MKRKFFIIPTMLLGLIMSMSSCEDPGETLVVAGTEDFIPTLQNLIGDDSIPNAVTGMKQSVYDIFVFETDTAGAGTFTNIKQNFGIFPPAIEGTFVMSPYLLVYSTDINDGFNITSQIPQPSRYIRFSNQNNRTCSFRGKQQGGSLEKVDSVYLMGNGNKFTAYYLSDQPVSKNGYSWINKKINVFTGTVATTDDANGNKTITGIVDAKYGFYIKSMDFGYTLTHNDSVALAALNTVGTLKFYRDNQGPAEATTTTELD